MAAESLMLSNLIEVLGWTLLHFVWQGIAAAVLLAALLLMLRRASAPSRYLAACGVFALMAFAPLVTAGWLSAQTRDIGSKVSLDARSVGRVIETHQPLATDVVGLDDSTHPTDERSHAHRMASENVADGASVGSRTETASATPSDLANVDRTLIERSKGLFEHYLGGIVGAWLLGVTLLSLRLLAGWLSVQRLRRRSSQPANDNWQALLHRLSERLRVTRPVKLVESALVEVPAVIGWLRPVILLPATAMTGLTTEQLEALLAHELAHVRRHDYLINLLQTIVETLLFYHPAVWWLSHRIRLEREHCCDDLAASVCGNRLSYVKALVAMEELRAPKVGLAMSSNGGSLLTRVARLLGRADQDRRSVGWVAGLVSIVVLIAAGVLGAGLLTPPDKPTEGLPNETQPTPTKATGTNQEPSGQAEKRDPEAERIERANRHVRKLLGSRVDVAFTDVPLSDVAVYLSDYCEMAVVINSSADLVHGRGRREAKSEPITIVVRDELSSVLPVMLHPLGLSYCVERGQLVLASPEEVRKRGHKLPRTFAEELETLRKADPAIAWEALRRGGFDAVEHRKLVPLLIKVLDHDDDFVKHAAARALIVFQEGARSIQPAVEKLQPAVEKLTTSPNKSVRRAAWDLLREIGRKDLSTWPLFLAAWNNNDEVVREDWIYSIYLFAESSPRVFDELLALFPSSSVEFRRTCSQVLRLQSTHPSYEKLAVLAMADGDEEVRYLALRHAKPEVLSSEMLSSWRLRMKDVSPRCRILVASYLLPIESDRLDALEVLLDEIGSADLSRKQASARVFADYRDHGNGFRLRDLLLRRSVTGDEAQRAAVRQALKCVPESKGNSLVLKDIDAQLENVREYTKFPLAKRLELMDELGQDRTSPTVPEELRARVAHHLAHYFAKWDIVEHNARVWKYGQAALNLDVDPVRRASLYSLLGTAALEEKDTKSFADRWRNAAKIWLNGYREVTELNLPRVAPELPNVEKLGDLSTVAPVRRAEIERHDAEQSEAREKAEFVRTIVAQRQLLAKQIVESYRHDPRNDGELRQLATDALKDKTLVEELLSEGDSRRAPPRKLEDQNGASTENFGRIVGRVRLKTEKVLPDLEKVVVPAGRVLDESLVFAKDGGLANVFVYLRKPTFQFEPPPSDKTPKPFVLIAEGGKFWPHTAFVRVGRTVVFENRQKEPVNFRMDPLRNVAFNVLVTMQEHVKLQAFRRSETVPFAMKCDVQPWMLAYLLTLDHPFAAVTDDDGRFTIDGLPPGEHEFRVWHERVGYLEKTYFVTIKPGEETRTELEYEPERLKLTEAEVLAWGNRQIDAKLILRPRVPRIAVPEPKDDKDADLRSDSAAGSGDPRRAQNDDLKSQISNLKPQIADSKSDVAKAAIERGIAFLKAQQQESGAWQGAPVDGVTALAAAALLQAGVKVDDPMVQKALSHLQKVEPVLSYTVALQTMVFCTASPKKDAELIRRNVAWLENAQVTEGKSRGSWSYGLNNGGRGDGSCSRFAMLGLHAAKTAGFDVQAETWRRASEYWLTSQKPDGRWGYTPEAAPTPNMTLAGVAGLAIVNQHLPRDEQTKVRDASLRKPLEWLKEAVPQLGQASFGYYALHSLERAGRLSGVDRFGEVDWKANATNRLLERQRADGSWIGGGGLGTSAAENEFIATSFALLFLTGRADAPKLVPKK